MNELLRTQGSLMLLLKRLPSVSVSQDICQSSFTYFLSFHSEDPRELWKKAPENVAKSLEPSYFCNDDEGTEAMYYNAKILNETLSSFQSDHIYHVNDAVC